MNGEIQTDILTGDLRVDTIGIELKKNFTFEKLYKNISDDYYEDWEAHPLPYCREKITQTSFHAYRCLSHAYKQVKRIKSKIKKEKNPSSDIFIFQTDINHFFASLEELASFFSTPEYQDETFEELTPLQNHLYDFIEYMSSLNDYNIDELVLVLSKKSMQFIENQLGLFNDAVKLAKRLLNIGDYYLYIKGNSNVAYWLYRIARDYCENLNIDSQTDKDYLEIVGSIQAADIFDQKTKESLLVADMREAFPKSINESVLEDIYKFLEINSKQLHSGKWIEKNEEQLLEIANQLFIKVSKMVHDKSFSYKSNRSLVLITYNIIEKTLPYYLWWLAKNHHDTKKCILPDEIYYDIAHKYGDFRYFYYVRNVLPFYKYKIKKGKIGNQYLRELYYTIGSIEILKKILSVRKLTKDIAYYCSFDTLKFLLPNTADFSDKEDKHAGRFSVMNVGHMNDPNEGKVLDKYLFEDIQKEKNDDKMIPLKTPYVFLKSFTTRIDDLSMWETYGDSAKGVCVILNKDKIKPHCNYRLYNVFYLKRDDHGYILDEDSEIGQNEDVSNEVIKILKWLKNEVKDTNGFLNKSHRCHAYNIFIDYLKYETGRIGYLFKDAAYIHENEKRLLYIHNSYKDKEIRHTPKDPIRLYVYSEEDAVIKSIILGPKFQKTEDNLPYLQYRCEALADRLALDEIQIYKSRIKYI